MPSSFPGSKCPERNDNSQVHIMRSNIAVTFIFLSLPLIRNCANHLKIIGTKQISVNTCISDGSRLTAGEPTLRN
jgi:hypothetical protein